MTAVDVEKALSGRTSDRGLALLGIAEDQWFDRKSIRISAKALANVEVGFANADGGTLLIGLGDGKVEGTDSDPARCNALLQAAVDFTVPPVRARSKLVRCTNEDGQADHLIVLEIEPSDVVHANHRDEAFLRVGDENRKLSYRQRQELIFDKGQAVFEATPVPEADAGELRSDLLIQYARAVGHSDPDRLLVARGLAKTDGRVTVAGYLLFASNPQMHFPEAY